MEGILNINPKVLLLQIGGFVLLVIVFKVFLWGPVLGILEARRKEVDDYYDDAEKNRKVAEDLKTQYEQHLAEIDSEMRAKIAEAVKEGQTMREEILSDSRSQAEHVLTKAQEEIQREKDKAVIELKTRVADLTVAAASKLMEEQLDSEKHKQLISKFIDDLDGVAK